jgi:capsular exopolysaccharide synthesis family protein
VLGMKDAYEPAGTSYYANYYKTQYEILRSRALAARAIREKGLGNDSFFAGRNTGSEDKSGLVAGLWAEGKAWTKDVLAGFLPPPPTTTRAKTPGTNGSLGVEPGLVGAYLSMLEIKPVRSTHLVKISFSTPQPALSARLADAHADAYSRYGLDLRSKANEEALTFLDGKLLELKERVEKSEAALNNFRRDKGIISIDDKENLVVDRLVDLNRRLSEAEAQRIALEAQVRVIQKGNYESLPGVVGSALVRTLKTQLGRLEGEYANLAGEFKPGYPALDQLGFQVESTRRRLLREIQTEVKAIEAAYLAADAKEKQLRVKMEEQKKATLNLKDSAVEYTILAREVDTNRQLYDSVLQRMKEMGVAAQIRGSNASVIDRAEVPSGPSYPNKRRSLLLGLLLGLAGGVGLAFFLDHLDSSLKTPEEVERYLQLPSLGLVPDFTKLSKGSYGYLPKSMSRSSSKENGSASSSLGKELVLSHHPLSLLSESYRSIRTAILLSQAGGPPKTILFTSATRQEGKTATTVNTGVIFAQMGYRVLIIDADLRRSRSHKVLGMENAAGLSELLAGQIRETEAIKQTPTENLSIVCGGSLPPNPGELVGSKKMYEVLRTLEQEYDCIFIDSPPIMPVSDPVLLSTMVDGVVLVVDGQKTPKQVVREVRSRLANARAKILGVVLNRINLQNGDYSYRHYYSYYHQDGTEKV